MTLVVNTVTPNMPLELYCQTPPASIVQQQGIEWSSLAFVHLGLDQTQKPNKGRVLYTQLGHLVTQMHICIDPKKIIFLIAWLTITLAIAKREMRKHICLGDI